MLLLFSENLHIDLGQILQPNSLDSLRMESKAGANQNDKIAVLNMKVETIMNSH